MEPASWVFVAFGLAGGGFMHKRRPRGLNLTSSSPVSAPQQGEEPGAASSKTHGILTLAILVLIGAGTASADSIGPPPPKDALAEVDLGSISTLASESEIVYDFPIASAEQPLSLESSFSLEPERDEFPVQLGSEVKLAPEPGSLLLLGTGIVAGALVVAKRGAVRKT